MQYWERLELSGRYEEALGDPPVELRARQDVPPDKLTRPTLRDSRSAMSQRLTSHVGDLGVIPFPSAIPEYPGQEPAL